METSVNQTRKVELLQNPEYYLALAALFRDEARFLKEWIEFYRLMGVEHFYLFNHLSTDNYMEILAPYIQEGLVEVSNLTYEPKSPEEWRFYVQLKTYTDLSNAIKDDVEWLILVDTDEYLYPVIEQNISSVLKNYDTYASVAANWQLFGSNNVQYINQNELLIENLVKRDSVMNLHVKSIVKPRYVESFPYSHCANMKPGFSKVTENFQYIDGPLSLVPSYNVFVINHYISRDLDFFQTKKLSRVHLLSKDLSSEERAVKVNKLIEQNEKHSSIYDDKILRFAPYLKKQMFEDQDTEYTSSKLIDIGTNKKLAQLPSNLAYIIEVQNNTVLPYSVKNGYGYEPYIINKIMAFIQEGESYLEIGSGYGEFVMQISKKLGQNGKVYSYESDEDLYKYLTTNIFINDLYNIEFGEVIPGNICADVIRINSQGNECNLIKNIQNISANQRLFIKVQSDMKDCLRDLEVEGFSFIDINKYNEECSYLVYQQDYRLSAEDVTANKEILVIKEEEFEYFRKLFSVTKTCKELANQIMFNAATLGENEYIKLALSNGADINFYHEVLLGSALYYAIGHNRTETVELLIEAGADIELGFRKEISPLFFAVDEGSAHIVKLLLKAGAQVGGINSAFGATMLHIAAKKGYFEVAKLLLEYGANREIQAQGVSPFFIALQNNHLRIAIMLAGSEDNFYQQIQGTEYEDIYIEIDREKNLDSSITSKDGKLRLLYNNSIREKGDISVENNITVQQFTSDWFSLNIPIWNKYKDFFYNKPNIKCLEIGSFEGRSIIYVAENFCNGNQSYIDALDTWEGSIEHAQIYKENLYDRFIGNVNKYILEGRINVYKNYSLNTLIQFVQEVKLGSKDKYDFIYIDGSHTAKDVLIDAVLSWELLKINGIMIFDDYAWYEHYRESSRDEMTPRPAIDGFLASYKGAYNILHKEDQVHILKLKENRAVDDNLYDFVISQNIEGIKSSLAQGAEIDFLHPIGATALNIAVEKGFYAVTSLLLEKGANPNISGRIGVSALYQSAVDNNYEIAKLLLANNANTEFALSTGATPLFAASYFGFDDMVKLLLEYGAYREVQVQGISAFYVALQNDHLNTAIILAGSKQNFCQQIIETEYEIQYVELCGNNENAMEILN